MQTAFKNFFPMPPEAVYYAYQDLARGIQDAQKPTSWGSVSLQERVGAQTVYLNKGTLSGLFCSF